MKRPKIETKKEDSPAPEAGGVAPGVGEVKMEKKDNPYGSDSSQEGDEKSRPYTEGDYENERVSHRLEFERVARKLLSGERKVGDVGRKFIEGLKNLNTRFGNFLETLGEASVEKVEASGPAAHDLLPVSVEAILEADFFEDRNVRGWVAYTALCLNFWYCTGWKRLDHLVHPRELTESQKDMVFLHLKPAVERMLEGAPELPTLKELEKVLSQKGQDYQGNSWVKMEELDCNKVVQCWPDPGKAAVQPLARFLTGETLRQVEKPMESILAYDEWPDDMPKSYVRATTEEWEKIVAEGYKRGLFHYCPEEEVLKGPDGSKIVNGAGAVPKEKNGQILQRFISIFCPLNAVSRKIEGEEGTLPYVGQVTLMLVPQEECLLLDSEDLQSAFNLFEMPLGWRGLFCYEKKVRGDILGLASPEPVYVALRTVPMGWVSAVGVVQAAIRHLAFGVAGIQTEGELQKEKDMPPGDKFLLYLDSVDQLRPVSRAMARVMEGTPSTEHEKFARACDKMGLPRNESKALAGALAGSIQGGELRGEEGIFMLHPKKMQQNVGMCLALLGMRTWTQNRTAGVVGRLIFAGAFRRPLLSGLAEVFHHFTSPKERAASNQAYDEVAAMMGLLPLAFTNLRAPVNPLLHATDASPTGAGSCTAQCIKRVPGSCSIADTLCASCREDMAEEMGTGEEFECPKKCGQHFCSLECYLEHRDTCPHKTMGVPTFSERFSGPNSPLTKSMLRRGFDVLPPFDRARDSAMDFFSDAGRQRWRELDEAEPDYEHYGPDCKTMSRARGKPYYIGGRRYEGPPPLRDERHVMGFPNLRGDDAVRVRQHNKMALTSISRCKKAHQDQRYFSLEHPWRSFIWYMRPMIELAALPGVGMAVFSNCCHGGKRKKWTSVITNNPGIFGALDQQECPHEDTESYAPYKVDGRIVYPTEEEAEYPKLLCDRYAAGAAQHLQLDRHVHEAFSLARIAKLEKDLEKYHRCQDLQLRRQMAQAILELENKCIPGKETEHLQWLLSKGHYRGSDIRLAFEDQGAKHLVPYPAGRWLWRDLLSFKWKQEGHINVLEAQACFAHIRRILRDPTLRSCRILVVLDSQVLYFALGKGRSPSTQLNRILRRVMALSLAADVMLYPIWTISAWNWADRPSRRA